MTLPAFEAEISLITDRCIGTASFRSKPGNEAVALYDRIGHGYDATRRADPEIVQRLIRLLDPQPGGLYLDVACGTGNYTAALASAGLRMVGLDNSARMIAEARGKRADVAWLLGDVQQLPFGDDCFAGAVCTLATHHFPSLEGAFGELHRVLGGGRFAIFTFDPLQMRGYWLNEYFPQAMQRSIEKGPRLDLVMAAFGASGFHSLRTETYEVSPDLLDLFLYSGKYRPELYLNPHVRAGISTFAVLADPVEVDAGCQRLKRDIDSGRITEVAASYRNDGGDYLFIVAE